MRLARAASPSMMGTMGWVLANGEAGCRHLLSGSRRCSRRGGLELAALGELLEHGEAAPATTGARVLLNR